MTILFWSSAFAGIRLALESYAPHHLVLLRFLAASAAFGVYAVVRRIPMPKKEDWGQFILLGLLAVTIYHTALSYGQQTVPAGTAGLIVATVPVFTAILSRVFLAERLTSLAWSGLALSLFGIGIMTLGGKSELGFTLGVIFIVISAISGAAHIILVKPILQRYPPVETMAYVTWAGTIPLLIFSPGLWGAISSASWQSTLVTFYIGVFPAGLAQATWTFALAHLPVSRAAAFMYLVSPLAIVWGWLLAGEKPAFVTLVGGIVVLLGVYLVQRPGRRKSFAPEVIQQ